MEPKGKILTKYTVYVLKLAQGRYYVGRCNPSRLEIRIQQHRERKACQFTKIYGFVEELKDRYLYDASPFQEDRVTKELMFQYGIDKVRGGTYCQYKITPQQMEFLLKEIHGATNKCYRCGVEGHFISKCPSIKPQEKPTQKKPEVPEVRNNNKKQPQKKITEVHQVKSYYPFCSICRQLGHFTNQCDRKNFSETTKKYYQSSVKCYKCHQYGHYANECSTTFDNSDQYEYYEDQYQEDICHYCQKPGHWIASCWKRQSDERRQPETQIDICYYCNTPGHRVPNCRKKQRDERIQHESSQSEDRCHYCHKIGHWVDSCYKKQKDQREQQRNRGYRGNNYPSRRNNYY